MPIYRIKNNTSNNIDIFGITISAQTYYDIPQTEIELWKNDYRVFQLVANGSLIVNNGSDDIDDIINPVEGWRYLEGDIKPPVDTKGRWKIIIDDPSDENHKKSFMLTSSVFLDADSEYHENIKLKPDETLYIYNICSMSPSIPFKTSIEYWEENNGYLHRSAGNMLYDGMATFVVDASADANTNTIVLSALNYNDFNHIIVSGIYYIFGNRVNSVNGKYYAVKIVNVNAATHEVTIEKPLSFDLHPDDLLVFGERPLLNLSNDRDISILSFSYHPLKLKTEATSSFIKIRIENVSNQYAGEVSFTMCGYIEKR